MLYIVFIYKLKNYLHIYASLYIDITIWSLIVYHLYLGSYSFRCITLSLLSSVSMYSCSFENDATLNITGITFKIGFCFCRHRIQDNKESFVDVPVAHIAKYVPSFCSWTVGTGTISFLSQKGILIFETSIRKKEYALKKNMCNSIFLVKSQA